MIQIATAPSVASSGEFYFENVEIFDPIWDVDSAGNAIYPPPSGSWTSAYKLEPGRYWGQVRLQNSNVDEWYSKPIPFTVKDNSPPASTGGNGGGSHGGSSGQTCNVSILKAGPRYWFQNVHSVGVNCSRTKFLLKHALTSGHGGNVWYRDGWRWQAKTAGDPTVWRINGRKGSNSIKALYSVF